MDAISQFHEFIEDSHHIVFFGGAGVSTDSGIPDFRSDKGLYSHDSLDQYPPEQILSHSFFMQHTDAFFTFYRKKMIYAKAKPNASHMALAKWEVKGRLKAVITQNIDGLHQMAGNHNVLELHGSVHRNYCMKCHMFYGLNFILGTSGVPKCSRCGGIIKPDVVLYEEPLKSDILAASIDAISKSDALVVGGTSLSVYPAANLITYYKGKKLVLINITPTPYDKRANLVIHKKLSEVLSSTSISFE